MTSKALIKLYLGSLSDSLLHSRRSSESKDLAYDYDDAL